MATKMSAPWTSILTKSEWIMAILPRKPAYAHIDCRENWDLNDTEPLSGVAKLPLSTVNSASN